MAIKGIVWLVGKGVCGGGTTLGIYSKRDIALERVDKIIRSYGIQWKGKPLSVDNYPQKNVHRNRGSIKWTGLYGAWVYLQKREVDDDDGTRA